ncbi:DUF2569 family protein [Candidatus Pacearchaeota archaeon]|nr:DUF2569 family protein [Candidatus Pacearchaeota archaeon]
MRNSTKGIGGWLLVVLLMCILSGISNFILLVQKITNIFTLNVLQGVYLSAFLLLVYCIFIGITIFMILTKKKFAVKSFIIAAIVGTVFLIWYYIVAQLIYNPNVPIISNLIIVIVNISINILVAAYLTKSRRVKNTLK